MNFKNLTVGLHVYYVHNPHVKFWLVMVNNDFIRSSNKMICLFVFKLFFQCSIMTLKMTFFFSDWLTWKTINILCRHKSDKSDGGGGGGDGSVSELKVVWW